jgi:glyceraldehyde-3-phosphate dehydrogenase (NADP+)
MRRRPEDDCVVTPVISHSSAEFIEGLVKDAEAKGATLCMPYRREANLIWPMVVDGITNDMR